MEFDENKAIKLMRKSIPADASSRYDDDQLLNIIDMIWDYYEENGMLEIDLEDESEDEDLAGDLTDYVLRMLRKDKGAIVEPEHVRPMVEAELAYEASLENE